MSVRAMRWEAGRLWLLDQRALPSEERWLCLSHWREVADAIRDMAVRGAPAIGVAAAYGLALAAQSGESVEDAAEVLADTRPTAVNLLWAIERLLSASDRSFPSLLALAQSIEREDVEANMAIGRHGAELLKDGSSVLTICNTGSLATSGHGTALGVIRTGYATGKVSFVYSCETRPRLQGLRLTAWELLRDGVPFAAIADSVAAKLMREGRVDAVIVGADRIAANGDTANKIGTYALAVLASHHGVPFFVAAPCATIDPSTASGEDIPIEERSASEVTHIDGVAIAPQGCPVHNPAFDVTPSHLIGAIVTEKGVHRAPYRFATQFRQNDLPAATNHSPRL